MASRTGSLAKVECLKCRCRLPAVASFFLASPFVRVDEDEIGDVARGERGK